MKPLSQFSFSVSHNSGSGLDMVWTVNIFLGEKCVLTFCLGTYPCTDVIFFCLIIAFAFKFLPLLLYKRYCFVLLTPLSNWSLSPFLARCLSSLNLCWANHFSGSKKWRQLLWCFSEVTSQNSHESTVCITSLGSSLKSLVSVALDYKASPIKEVLLLAEQ